MSTRATDAVPGDRTATAADAYARVTLARIGSLAGTCSEEYLIALRTDLLDWVDAIDRKLATRAQEAQP